MTGTGIPEAALAAVEAAAARVRTLEAEANTALHQRGDTAGHRALMIEKCQALKDLPETVGPLLAGASGALVDDFRDGLAGFARRAGQALSLGSIFYMTALLYPDDYQDGQPNDLERFAAGYRGD